MRITRSLMIVAALGLPMTALAQEKQPEPAKQKQTGAKVDTEVKSHVLPIAAKIEAAQASASALHQLSSTPQVKGKDMRETADLAESSLKTAQKRADQLSKIEGLSSEARDSAKTAAKELKTAHSTAKEIDKQVGGVDGAFRQEQAQKLRSMSEKLGSELERANDAVKKVAEAYKIETDLEMPQKQK